MITKSNIFEAIDICRAGNLDFKNGEKLYCFLYENTWLPLSAIVNKAGRLSGDNSHYTKNSALVILVDLFDYVKVKQVKVENRILIHLSEVEKREEIEHLTEIIKNLSN